MTDPSATPLGRAAQAQARASAPATSAWVGASAGSGKTKVLTDRVLRLLLEPGADPRRILCLTFTRAGAAEMATRLARELGRWAVAADRPLADEVARLTGAPPAPATLARARTLLARVLEVPGGMRIATIHGFCQSLLRSFPLEADLPPQFRLMDERDARALLAEVREAVLGGGASHPDLAEALRALAGLVPFERFGALLETLSAQRARLEAAAGPGGDGTAGFGALRARLAAELGLAPPGGGPALDEAAVVLAACSAPDGALPRAARLLGDSRNENDRLRGETMLGWLAGTPGERAARWGEWSGLFLTKEEEPRADKGFATKSGLAPRKDETHYRQVLETMRMEASRVHEVSGRRRAARLHAATDALLGLAGPVLAGYGARKRRAGLLDYDDLVARAAAILGDPGSAWVLFKLDGGLDHVLLDESQDSNAHQWGVADALTAEFFAGAGAHDGPPRTVFAVGDPKQSIFGFQGADADGFHTWRDRFAGRLARSGGALETVELDVSFRSTAPVLALVDAVFEGEGAREGVVAPGGRALRHVPARAGQAGRVELWPAFPAAAPARPEPWTVPAAPAASAPPEALLAEALAARVRSWLADGEPLPSRGRAMRAGDVLVLVQKRSGLLQRLVRALKERGVPVGGVDRLRLVEQIAVQDVLALADVLLLPRDDLALAALLRSPLCGLDEAELFALAHDRGRAPLWERLAAARAGGGAAGAAADWIAVLMARADLLTPHALLAGVLGEGGGRARLLARLGPDASDPLDELLNAALDYEARHPPSLQGFVHWLRRGGAEVKREAEAAADAVRIMTVHGSKGLQAPVVILPDVGPGGGAEELRWTEPGPDGVALPLWACRKDLRAPAFNAAVQRDAGRRGEETNRLLYVALTRAEDRLLVAGLEPARRTADAPPRWHPLVAQGFGRLRGREGFSEETFDPAAFGGPDVPGLGPVLVLDCPQAVAPDLAHGGPGAPSPPGGDGEAGALPAWAARPAPAEAAALTVQPSALPGETGTPAAPHGAADPAGVRFRRGRLVHALLQHLPDRAPAERAEAARLYLARPGHGLDAAERALIRDEVLALLDHPALAEAFGPDALAEAPVAGRIGSALVAGQVDRLLVTPDRVTVLDYKTNRPPPEAPEAAPPAYLRQMAAYRAVLRRAFPGRAVACALVWTYGARAMPLPDALLDAHAPAGGG